MGPLKTRAIEGAVRWGWRNNSGTADSIEMPDHSIAFVAYSSHDAAVARLIMDAVRLANSKSSAIRYEPWEFNDIPGHPVISPILERITESQFVVADITYLNLNVVYEIGFAIGSKKRAFLIKHKSTQGDDDIARQAGIFDTLGYQTYENAEDLAHRLTSHIDPTPLQFSPAPDLKSPVYVVEPPMRGDAATILVSRIKKARYRYRSFTPSEEARLSATDAIRQVAASAGVFTSLYPTTPDWGKVHNVRSMFVAGLAEGMGKPVLILAPKDYEVPMDVRDDARTYGRAEDIVESVATFVPEIADYLQRSDPTPLKLATPLQSLKMGDSTAENEMTTLGRYYVPTDEYGRTLRGEVNLVVGRKGSGKTALFIQVRDALRPDKRNIVVDLKPEGYQLIKLKEDILGYLGEGARQHLITAFWEYLILLEVAYKLLEKDKVTHKYNHEIYDLYRELEVTYNSEGPLAEGDFSERLLALSQRIAAEYKAKFGIAQQQRLTTDQISKLLYRHDIKKLEFLITQYLKKKRSVWVLFDNLDKGWSTGGIDEIDAIALRCLIDAGRKLERDIRRLDLPFHCIVFIRNDVYEQLMENSSDYGKEMRAVLDWNDPDLLREMLRRRLVFGLGLERDISFDKIWQQVCVSHIRGIDSAAYIIERSLMRPRNVLKLFGHCRGFANNFGRILVGEEDIEKGAKSYSLDLFVELGLELGDIIPGVKDLLYYFLDAKPEMTLAEVKELLNRAGVEAEDQLTLVDFLLYYGVLGLRVGNVDQYIFNVNYDPKVIQIRAELAGDKARYIVNPAFYPALGIESQDAHVGG